MTGSEVMETAAPLVRADVTTGPDWSAAIAGAFIAAALFFVLLAFGVSVGLGVSSSSPTWRDTSFALAFLSGLYILLSAVVCFGVGGYLGGKLHTALRPAPAPEVQFRDGVHGLLVWAIAVVIGAVLSTVAATAVGSHALPRGSSTDTSSAEPLLSYQLDRLFRSDREPGAGPSTYERAESGRILLTSSSHSGVSPVDRSYLVRVVGRLTALPAADAQRRVDTIIADSRNALAQARHSAVLVGFMIAAALLVGAAIAWEAATIAGRERDGGPIDYGNWWRFPEFRFWKGSTPSTLDR